MREALPFSWDGYRMYDALNPHVFMLLERFMLEWITSTTSHVGMKAVVERVRWEVNIKTNDPDLWKINDRWTAFAVRRFLSAHPQHWGRMELRAAVANHGWDGSAML